MMEKFFHLAQNNTTMRREVISGLTTFLAMVYILFTNSSILAETGMPWYGVFVATALSASVCTMIISLYSNLPFAMAPGMGLNTIFTYMFCTNLGYHWKEALAITFLAGVLHIVIMRTSLRKAFVNAFPEYLRVASGVGLGMFVAYVGIKNSGLLEFNFNSGIMEGFEGHVVVSGSYAVPSLVSNITSVQMVAVIGFAVMIVLTALEKKTGDRYAALPVGILVATFIGIPMNVGGLNVAHTGGATLAEGFNEVFLSFFGSPGLLTIFNNPSTAARSLLMICVLNMTNVLDSVGTMIGIGQIHNAKLFDDDDMERFARAGTKSRLDRALISNSIGNTLSPLFGSSSSTVFLESVTGIVSGGRTGLTGLVTGFLFLLCIPLSGLFHIIPSEAVAPALILAGVSMLTRLRYINWRSFEESFPAFMTMLFMPITYSILDGICIGILSHLVIQITLGKRKDVHFILYAFSAIYIVIKLCEHIMVG